MDHTPTCLWCGASLERRGRRGPAPRYCSERCRQAARRYRLAAQWHEPLVPGAVIAGVSPQLVIAQAVRELRCAAVAMAAVAPYVPPLAGRAERTASAVRRLLDEEWEDA